MQLQNIFVFLMRISSFKKMYFLAENKNFDLSVWKSYEKNADENDDDAIITFIEIKFFIYRKTRILQIFYIQY